MKSKVSLKDIAKIAGVSIATVSYVLSKRENSGISEEMSNKIRKIAEELDYRPNQIAKSLQSGKTFTIGLIVADISNPFFANIARIIEDKAQQHDYTVIFGSSDEQPEKLAHLVKFLLKRQVDGFIIAPTEGSLEQIQELKAQHVPFVLIDRFFPELETNHVVIDNYQAAYEATQRLIETGNKTIGMIAYSSSLNHMKERIHGYSSALQDHNVPFKSDWLREIRFSEIDTDVKIAVNDLLTSTQPVDAILFATNTLALKGLKQIEELELKIPEDVAIIVFDQSEAFDFFYSPLTYIEQPLVEIGEQAVEILVDQITNASETFKQFKLEAKTVIRNSCATSSKTF